MIHPSILIQTHSGPNDLGRWMQRLSRRTTLRSMSLVLADGRLRCVQTKDLTPLITGCCSVCPGRHLADLTTWLAAANILATMDIRKARDHAGAEIEPKVSFVSALTRSVVLLAGESCPHSSEHCSRGPQKFACSICPRSLASVELIKQQLPDKPA